MNAPIIDTLEAVGLCHDAYEKLKSMDPSPERDHLQQVADSAFSASMVYVRHPQAPVQTKHYESIQALKEAMNGHTTSQT